MRYSFLIKANLVYGFIFLFLFFSGFDNFLLYRRTFIEGGQYETFNYLHFFFSSFGAWFIGYMVYRKIVEQYKIDFILKTSLVIAAFSTWIQYKYMLHSMDSQISGVMLYNFFLNLNLSCLAYSLFRVMARNPLIKRVKQSVLFLAPSILLTYLYSHNFNNSNLLYGFLASSLIYLTGFIVLYFQSIEKLLNQIEQHMAEHKKKISLIVGVFLCFSIIALFIQALHSGIFDKTQDITSHQYFLFIYLFFMFMAAKRQKSYKIPPPS